MSARDDYPHIVALATTPREFEHVKQELNAALDEVDRLRDDLLLARMLELNKEIDDSLQVDADLQRESYMAADARERYATSALVNLARLALRGDHRDVALYMHRLVDHYRETAVGFELSTLVTVNATLRIDSSGDEVQAAAVRSWELNNEIDRLIADRDVYASALRDVLCAESGGAHLLPVEWEERIAPLVWRWESSHSSEAM